MFKLGRKQSWKKVSLLSIIFVVLCLFSSTVTAQLFSNVHELNTSVDETTSVFFLGDISLSGDFQSVQMNTSMDSFKTYFDLLGESVFPTDLHRFSNWEQIYGFPVFSQAKITQVNAYVVNTSMLSGFDSLSFDDISDGVDQILTSYENCSVSVTDGIAVMGSEKQKYSVVHNRSYGIGGLINIPLSDSFPSTGIGFLSDEESILFSFSNGSFLYPFESTIVIQRENQVVQQISNAEKIVLITSQDLVTITQDSLLHFFPLITTDQGAANGSISISKTAHPEKNFLSLITEIETILSEFESVPMDDIVSFQQEQVVEIAPLLSRVFNSGMIIINGTQPLTIDGSMNTNYSIIAGRGSFFSLDINQQASSPVFIQGTPSLLFINDHLFITGETTSTKGVSLPLVSIVFWIIAIFSIVFLFGAKKYHRLHQKQGSEIEILQYRWVKWSLPMLMLFLCFLLTDVAFSARFGLSFFTLLTSQTSSMIVGLFFLVQVVILLILFVLYAVPMQLVHQVICKTTIENKYQTLTKNVLILPFFWIGIQLYLLVLFNIVLSFLPFSTIPMVG